MFRPTASDRTNRRLLAAAGFTAASLALTGAGVYAALTATASNSTPQTVTTGTLSLTMADNGAGFTSAISNLVPGDVVNRYVDLNQGSSLDGRNLTLSVTDSTPSLLTTSATKGLRVTISSCTGGTWTPGTAVCGGTSTALVNNVAIGSVSSTAIASSFPKGTAMHLQVSLALPDTVETTVNGTVPSGTIQGLSASLTWTFSDTQRAATTTNS